MAATGARVRPARGAARFDLRALVAFFALAYALSWSWAISLAAAHAIRIRRECPELGWGQWRTLDAGDPRVLAIDTRWRDGRVVTLHNLSAEPATVHLPGDLGDQAQARTTEVRQVLGDAEPPSSTGQEIALGGYGFRWLRLD